MCTIVACENLTNLKSCVIQCNTIQCMWKEKGINSLYQKQKNCHNFYMYIDHSHNLLHIKVKLHVIYKKKPSSSLIYQCIDLFELFNLNNRISDSKYILLTLSGDVFLQ